MSTITGSPRRDRARTPSRGRPRPRAVGDDHVVGQLGAELGRAGLHRLAHALARGARHERVDQLGGDGHGRVGGPLRAPDPSSCPGVLTAAARGEALLVDASSTPPARRWSATATGKPNGTLGRRSTPSSRHARRQVSSLDLLDPKALGEQIVAPERDRIDRLDARGAHLVGVEHRDHRHAAVAVLDVEEGIGDPGRHGVEEVERELG